MPLRAHRGRPQGARRAPLHQRHPGLKPAGAGKDTKTVHPKPSKGKRLKKGPATFKVENPCPEGYDPLLFQSLTLTQRKFVRAYFTNGFKEKEAALAAGLEDGPGIYAQSSRMLRNVKIGLNWEQIFEARGITDSKLADVVIGSLEAESAVVTEESTYGPDGKITSKGEKVTFVVDAGAHRTRLEGAKVMGKWKGREKTVVAAPNDGSAPFKLPLTIEDPDVLRFLAAITGAIKEGS